MDNPLKKLRKQRGLSQRKLAAHCRISRGRLRRIEGGEFERVTFGEIKRISEFLDLEPRELLPQALMEGEAYFGKVGSVAFELGGPAAGYRLLSFHPLNRQLFAGKLFVAGKKQPDLLKTLQGNVIFLQVLLGAFKVETHSGCYEAREGDCLLLRGDSASKIENPLERESVALILTSPGILAA